ncbi:MAG: biopolymer transporter ExbD [Kiritimatiellales bacterium]|nr:biopolymer transporter ExbD [Kiritimatiellales bacterium]
MKLNLVEDFDADIDMSPMIDMVFLLLIFFIVAAAMVDMDKPTVDLPAAAAAKVAEDVTGRLVVSVDLNEQFYVGAVPVSEEALVARLTDEVKMNPDLRVLIRSDEMVPYRVNKKLMRLCGDVGAVNLIYAAFEE